MRHNNAGIVSWGERTSKARPCFLAVGHRNVTKMEALIQNLAEESILEPAWKFDDGIKKVREEHPDRPQ